MKALKNEITIIYQQMPSHNERFHASGGVARPTLRVEQQPSLSSEPLRYPRLREAATTLAATRADSTA